MQDLRPGQLVKGAVPGGTSDVQGPVLVDPLDDPVVAVLDPAAPVVQIPLVVSGDDQVCNVIHVRMGRADHRA